MEEGTFYVGFFLRGGYSSLLKVLLFVSMWDVALSKKKIRFLSFFFAFSAFFTAGESTHSVRGISYTYIWKC